MKVSLGGCDIPIEDKEIERRNEFVLDSKKRYCLYAEKKNIYIYIYTYMGRIIG